MILSGLFAAVFAGQSDEIDTGLNVSVQKTAIGEYGVDFISAGFDRFGYFGFNLCKVGSSVGKVDNGGDFDVLRYELQSQGNEFLINANCRSIAVRGYGHAGRYR